MFRRPTIVLAVTALLTVPTATEVAHAAKPKPKPPHHHPSSVVLDWERTSFRTVYGPPEVSPTRTPIPVGVPYLGFVSLAMRDAVKKARHGGRAADEAAAATAAHDVLVGYFPTSGPELDAALATSLAMVKDGKGKAAGISVGRQVAADLIADRADDGRGDTSVVYSKPMLPGFWQPSGTPPVPMLAPWLGSVDPLVLDHLVETDGPPDLTSDDYADDYDEVLRLGSVDSSERTAFQTDTARFFNSNAAIMVSEGVIDLLEQEPMGLKRTALLFARMHGAMADSIITTWQLKRDVGLWRPFQAIAGWNTDGNCATGPWTGSTQPWTPLIANPPYADYTSGHAGATAPVVETLRMVLGEDTSLTLHSYLTGADRTYDDLSSIEHDAFHARIWGGLHFRTAMEHGYLMGHETARRVARELR